METQIQKPLTLLFQPILMVFKTLMLLNVDTINALFQLN